MLEVNSLQAGYGSLQVLDSVDLHVSKGEIVALLGPNGAGKTTLSKSVCGIIPTQKGVIRFRENEITPLPAHEIVQLGLILVPEERYLFTDLTVRENLKLGSRTKEAKTKREANLEKAYDLFPRLGERENQRAGSMSGGEQQMLTIARALMNEPRLIILDEPSTGLAPQLVEEVLDVIERLRDQGITILVSEQNVEKTLHIADRGYVIENGGVRAEGTSSELLEESDYIERIYLGQ